MKPSKLSLAEGFKMVSRRELEGLIEWLVSDLHKAEGDLRQRSRSLSRASVAERHAFVASLSELQEHASLVETLIAAMPQASSSEPLAA